MGWDDLPPDASSSWDSLPPEAPVRQPSVLQNAGEELKGMARTSLPMLGALTPTNPFTIAKSAYQGVTGTPMGETDLGRDIRNIPKLPGQIARQYSDEISHPTKHPVGAALDVLSVGAMAKPFLKPAGNFGARLGEWATNIPAKDFKTLADNPASMRPGVMERAGDNFERAQTNAGISSELTPEAVDRIRQPGQFGFDTYKRLKTEGSISPQDALHGRQSIDAAYPIPNKKNGAYIRMLDQIRDEFQNVIANTTPELKEASKDYAIAKSAQKFKSIFPQTNSGKPAYFRSGAILAGVAAGHPSALLGIPAVAGTITSGAGTLGKVANRIWGNRTARASMIGAGVSPLLRPNRREETGVIGHPENPPKRFDANPNGNNQPKGIPQVVQHTPPKKLLKTRQEKILTDDEAKNILKRAKGDRSKARQLAAADGWTIPQ